MGPTLGLVPGGRKFPVKFVPVTQRKSRALLRRRSGVRFPPGMLVMGL